MKANQNIKIDWEQRRYEIAKEMLAAIYLDDGNAERADDSECIFRSIPVHFPAVY